MTTAIYVIAALCVLVSIWYAWHTKRKCERKLQKCIDTCEESNDLRNAELQAAIHRADEATTTLANTKQTLLNLQNEYEVLKVEFESYMERTYDGPINLVKTDVDLKKSYDKLAESYSIASQQLENPSKTYLIRNIVKSYKGVNLSQLAKALGISQSAVSHMLKR